MELDSDLSRSVIDLGSFHRDRPELIRRVLDGFRNMSQNNISSRRYIYGSGFWTFQVDLHSVAVNEDRDGEVGE